MSTPTSRRGALARLSLGALACLLPSGLTAQRFSDESRHPYIPYRGSIKEGSPDYFLDPDLRITLNGQYPSHCIGYDRREGWVEVLDATGTPRRVHGTVRVWLAAHGRRAGPLVNLLEAA